jgi:1-acyl-sn-glycerol-3-phosphate acyltransferase
MQLGGRALDLAVYHERTRRRGVHPIVYWIVRAVLQPALQIYFRTSRMGRGNVPKTDGVLLAPNHRSFLDPFVIGTCIRRPIYFMAKQEMFTSRFRSWILNCMGAFPVRRGESDEEAMETARELVQRGEVVVIFPEGTRRKTGSLGEPKRGIGRLALETGAPVVPVAVIGSERARRGWRVRPVKVRIRMGRPLTFPTVEKPSPHVASEVTARIWPCVELMWEWLGGLPPLRKAVVIGEGQNAAWLNDLLTQGGLDMRVSRDGEDVEFAGLDLVCFTDAPQSAIAQGISERSAVLILCQESLGPLGVAPTHYVGERVRARAIATLSGPTDAPPTLLACDDADFRAQFEQVLSKATRPATGRFRERAAAAVRG